MLIEVGSSSLQIPTGARFLVVGTRPDDVRKLATVLSHLGHATTGAVGAEAARAAFEKKDPDLVLLLDGPDGYDTCRLVQELADEQHLCIVAGPRGDAARIVELFHAGAVRYLAVPYTARDVERCVRQVVQRLIEVRTREAVERELVESQRQLHETVADLEASNEELERFAYVVSHDLQEPLRNVASYVQLLRKRYGNELDEDAHEFIEFAAAGARRMRELINGLLEYSRVSTRGHEKEPTDMQEVLEEVRHDLAPLIAETGASVTSGELPTVTADTMQMRRLLQNLVGNALKFRSEEPPRVHLNAREAEAHWHFTVQDNGIGISPENAEEIFTVYRRLHTSREYEGTGIGLAVCRKIVERHGGRIWAEPNGDAGTAFHFTLPDG